MSSVTSPCGKHSGHRDHHSADRDQLIGISPERVIGIIPES
jgi:hypothetical protein